MKGAIIVINNVVLVGRLTKDADLRYTSNGAAVASFTVAVNRQFTNQKGEREADFINCVAWRKTAETLANFTRKGSLIGVEGRIQTRSYDNQQGQRVYVTEVVVENFSMLESKSANDQRRGSDDTDNTAKTHQQNSASQTQNNYSQKSAPQNQNSQYPDFGNSDPFEKSSQPIDISDDDLPF